MHYNTSLFNKILDISDYSKSDYEWLVARYLTKCREVSDEIIRNIVAGMSSGVEQVSNVSRTITFPCETRVPIPRNISELLKLEHVGKYCIFDIALHPSILDFKSGGFASIMSFIAGDIFGSSYGLSTLKLVNLYLPRTMTKHLNGPKFGAKGIRQLLGIENSTRPLIGLLLKPNLGCSPNYYAELIKDAVKAGVDFIKEDELLMNPSHCLRRKRIVAISRQVRTVLRETEGNVLYASNITGIRKNIKTLAKKATSAGANALMVNAIQMGLDSLKEISEDSHISVPIHVHRSGFDILASGNKSISINVITLLLRLAGADSVHIGPPFGGLFSQDEVYANYLMLSKPYHHFPGCLPVISRSSVDIMRPTISLLGTTDVLFLFDAYVYRHPKGLLQALSLAVNEANRIQIECATRRRLGDS